MCVYCAIDPQIISQRYDTLTCAAEADLETRLVLVAIVQTDIHLRPQKSAEHNVRFWLLFTLALSLHIRDPLCGHVAATQLILEAKILAPMM